MRIPYSKNLYKVAALVVMVTPLTLHAAEPTNWRWQISANAKLHFEGERNLDAEGLGIGSPLYPAQNAAVLAVSLITHALILDAQKDAQKATLQADADQVLLPLQSVLDSFTANELMRRSLAKVTVAQGGRLILPGEAAMEEWIVSSTPRLSLTQDRRALILNHTIDIHAPGQTPDPVFKSVVKVVSAPVAAQDLLEFWSANNGEALKDRSAELVAESLDIAFSAYRKKLAGSGLSEKSFRYHEGGAEKVERAKLLGRSCQRQLLLTLRQTLLSVPIANPSTRDADTPCSPGYFLDTNGQPAT